MVKVMINGKGCSLWSKVASIGDLYDAYMGLTEYDGENMCRYRCVYLAADGVIDMLPQYEMLTLFDGMIISLFHVDSNGREIIPEYKKRQNNT